MDEILHAAETIVAEIEISYRPTVNPLDCPKVVKAKDAYALFIQTWDTKKVAFVEEFRVMMLTADHRLLGICTIPRGVNVPTIIPPRLLFGVVLKAHAEEIIVAHNSPSGLIKPTPADQELCGILVSGGAVLGIRVADYLIVSTTGFYSCAFEGVL